MMKKIILLLPLLFFLSKGFSQIYQNNTAYGWQYNRMKIVNSLGIPIINNLSVPPDVPNNIEKAGHIACYINGSDTVLVMYNGFNWNEVGSSTISSTNYEMEEYSGLPVGTSYSYTLPHLPIDGSVTVQVNGVSLNTNNVYINGSYISIVDLWYPIDSTDKIKISYSYNP